MIADIAVVLHRGAVGVVGKVSVDVLMLFLSDNSSLSGFKAD